jgi:hypothetical protein
VSSVDSRTRWRISDPDIVVTVQRGSFALFPSGHTSISLSASQHGFVLACDSAQQTFTDRIAVRPHLAWMTLKRSGSRAVAGFGWSGERIDRRYDAAAQDYCSEDAFTEQGGGNHDEAGSASLASLFKVRLRFAASKLLAGRSIVLTVKVDRTRSDIFAGSGASSRLKGTYRLVLAR